MQLPTVEEADAGEMVAAVALSPVAAKAVPDVSGRTPPAIAAVLAPTTTRRCMRLIVRDMHVPFLQRRPSPLVTSRPLWSLAELFQL